MIVAIALMIDSFDFIDILWTEGKRSTWVTEVVMAFRSEWLGVLPPRLLQDHSSSGDTHCTALVQRQRGSGELLVNGSEPISATLNRLWMLAHHRSARPNPSTSPCLVSQQSSSHTSRWPSFQVAHPGTWVSLQQVTFSGINPRACFDSINSPLMFPFVQFFRFWWAVLIDPHGFSPIDRGNTCPLVATTKTMIVLNINEFSDYSM